MDSYPIKAVILTGPTASGKTELLDELFGREAFCFFSSPSAPARLKYHSATVISADSMQAYRGMDIGTAKPGPELRSRLPHELIDIKSPDEQYTAGEFAARADALCAVLTSRGVLPVISGGTGFYLRNFVCGLPSAPPADPRLRAAVAADLQSRGPQALRDELFDTDPDSARRIHERDLYRLTRAVEILRASGQAPSSFAPGALPRKEYEFLIIGVERPREELKERITLRVHAMFDEGLPVEVEALRNRGYTASCPGLKAIGYREFFEMEGSSHSRIAEAIALHSLQYAKRQMTFLRALPGIVWIRPEAEKLKQIVQSFLNAGLAPGNSS
ncbi:MAG: tRNA (adenosine(37)-N6)-dimethylallyltransferase MiaA [Spirochaetia bacterium]|nr:tRNA (adenosine(37)-N6)-dimethylallyltransferase MiaA [Spirochaetia bacterium]